MFDRYTEGARRTLFFARDEAFKLGGQAIEPEHLMLGLFRAGDEPVDVLLARARVTNESWRQEIENRSARSHSRPTFWTRLWGTASASASTPHQLPFSPKCKLALRRAAEEADRLRHSDIRPGHLLLGILQETRSVASTMLSGRGMRLDTVREDLFRRN